MRSISHIPTALLAMFLTACEGEDFSIDPLLSTDTLELAAPMAAAELPTAIDIIMATTAEASGGRFPERLEDAEQWDLAVRVINGQLALVPAAQVGLMDGNGPSRAAITEALAGRTFASVEEAPRRSDFVTDRGVALQQGAVYVARSRIAPCGFTASEHYAKLQPLEIDQAAQRVRLQIVSNGRCGDPRLVEED